MGEEEAGVATVAAPTGPNSGSGRWGTLTWAGRTLVISIAIAMASLGVLMLVSLTWPRSWDASIMEYIAWLINQGARPYRDVFDMNFPGTYLFHTAGQRLTGTSDLGFRLRDVTVLLGALAVFYRLMRRFPWPTAPMAVMLLAVQYLVIAGASGSLQRDWLVAIGVLTATVLLLGEPRAWRMLLAGVVLGAAASVKPNAVLMVLVVPIAVFGTGLVMSPVPPGGLRPALAQLVRRAPAQLGLVVTGAAVAVAVVLGWVALAGGWPDFIWVARNYMGSYSLLDGYGMETGSRLTSLTQVINGAFRRPDFFPFVMGALVLLFRRRPLAALRLLVVMLVIGGAGLVQALIAGKGWDYHYWTWTLAALGVFSVAAGDIWTGRFASWRHLPRWVSPVASTFFLCVVLVWLWPVDLTAIGWWRGHLSGALVLMPVVVLAIVDVAGALGATRVLAKRLVNSPLITLALSIPFLLGAAVMLNVAFNEAPEVRPSSERAIADVLEQRMAPDDRVQILATVGGKEAALKALAKNATPFIYDFHFFHDDESAINKELRSRFMGAWYENPPAFVIVYTGAGAWSYRKTFQDFERFADLAEALAGYTSIFKNAESEVLMRQGGR